MAEQRLITISLDEIAEWLIKEYGFATDIEVYSAVRLPCTTTVMVTFSFSEFDLHPHVKEKPGMTKEFEFGYQIAKEIKGLQKRLQHLENQHRFLHEHIMEMWPFIHSLISATGAKQDMYDDAVRHLKELIAMKKKEEPGMTDDC